MVTAGVPTSHTETWVFRLYKYSRRLPGGYEKSGRVLKQATGLKINADKYKMTELIDNGNGTDTGEP